MVSLTCPQCASTLRVKEELRGKRLRCPHCKAAVAVPGAVAASAGHEGGKQGKLSPAIHEDATLPPVAATADAEDVTLAPREAALAAGPGAATGGIEPGQAGFETRGSGQRYQVEGEIARGGMGAVLRATDQDIEREVALKYLLNQDDLRQKTRFIAEAKITGQLEHPNIVPIHDLGLDGEGKMYFSMKMVKGKSLADILKQQGEPGTQQGEPGALATGEEYTLGRLLTVFSNICNALAYAHSRNVIHRDLKPANIMVGDFGEVYVMDWGLAKVLGRDEGGRMKDEKKKQTRDAGSSFRLRPPPLSLDSGLTQDGSIMGTPAYMPPEQAKGDNEAVDQRSDIYSLGAILYEMLTLTPPVGRGGDALAILMRVVEGQIDPPAKRAPKRWIPPELSAIAMKGLAKDPDDRYQTVENLQRDIQLFQEGRSVSAKQDTFWEQFKKLVKRNKGVSISVGVLAPLLAAVLLYSAISNYRERAATAKAYKDYQDQVKKSVPAFVKAARLAAGQRNFDDAMEQVEVALASDPEHAAGRLLKAQLLVVRQDFAGAGQELTKYCATRPEDAAARRLADLCQDARPGDVNRLVTMAAVLNEQKAHALVDALLLKYGKNSNEARQFLLKMYREKINTAWPGKAASLTIDAFGLHLKMSGFRDVTDLAPLSGMPLTTLDIYDTSVADLSPLKGMPLTKLSCGMSRVKDLSPLRGMPLTVLGCQKTDVTDLSPLEGMPLTALHCSDTKISDLSPLKGMPLHTLDCSRTRVADLTPLTGMPLTSLSCGGTKISDLSPLTGLPLTTLECHSAPVADLSPLKNMPLTYLGCWKTRVTDLTPLEGLKLTTLYFWPGDITKGMDVVRNMKSLTRIDVSSGSGNYPAAEFWKRYDAGAFRK